MRKHPHKIWFLLVILITASFALPSPSFAQSESDLTRIEQWVLDQTLAGEDVVDLEKAPFANDHVLRAAFLEKLLFKQFDNLTLPQNTPRYKIHIEHAIFNEALDFENIEVPYEVWLGNSEFKNTVDFSESYFHQDLTLNGSIFDEDVDFYELHVGKDFALVNSQFKNAKEVYNFRSMTVDNFVFLQQAVFAEPVDFSYAEVGNNFEANGAQFNYAGDGVNDFSSMKVGGSVLFNPVSLKEGVKAVVFAGEVKFDDLDVGRPFEANGAQFKSKKSASFQHMKVGGALLLNAYYKDKVTYKTIFEGPADFRYTEIKTNFEADNAQFSEPVNLNHIKVGDSIRLLGTQFKGLVELNGSDCGTFYLKDVTWPGVNKVDIRGMTYKSIEAWRTRQDKAGQKILIESWQELKWLVEQSPYNAQTYTTLESFFNNAGHPERADEVYVAYKRRETQTLKDSKQGLWMWNWFFDKFVRFGRSPGRAWLWSLAVIFLGVIVFWNEEGMVDVSKKDYPLSEKDIYPYNPYWYSFDLFVGLVDLGFASRWEPKPGRKAAFIYSKFHKMAGWVLITIAVLTVTGLIK